MSPSNSSSTGLRSWRRGRRIDSTSTPAAKAIRIPSGQRYIRIVLSAGAEVGSGVGEAAWRASVALGAAAGPALVGVSVGTGCSAVAVQVGDGVDVGVSAATVGVGDAVAVATAVTVSVGVPRGLSNGDEVRVTPGVMVGTPGPVVGGVRMSGVSVGVATVCVPVGVEVGVGNTRRVGVYVGMRVGVGVHVGVDVRVGVGVHVAVAK
jgi:hypothetical protein